MHKYVIKNIDGSIAFKSIIRYFNATLALEAGVAHRDKYFPKYCQVDVTL